MMKKYTVILTIGFLTGFAGIGSAYAEANNKAKVVRTVALECPVGSGDYCKGKTPKCCYGTDFYCAAKCT
jgi:hypothetical protein